MKMKSHILTIALSLLFMFGTMQAQASLTADTGYQGDYTSDAIQSVKGESLNLGGDSDPAWINSKTTDSLSTVSRSHTPIKPIALASPYYRVLRLVDH